MSFARYFASFEQFVDNRLNPILVRELRQMVRSRFIVAMLNLYIGLLVFVCLSTVAFSTFMQQEGAGLNLFGVLATIMGIATFFVVVLYTGIVASSERINADLMYSSAIKPWQIVLGKFESGLLLSLLLFSAVFPFFTLAYLLRGLDLLTFLRTVYLIFLLLHTFNSVVIFVACAIRTTVQMVFVGFLLVFPFFYVVSGTLLSFSVSPIFGGVWDTILTVTLFALSIIGFFLIGAIVIVSPASSNRMLPMRLFLSLWFLLSLGFVLYFRSIWGAGFVDSLDMWCVLHLGLLAAYIPFLTSERDEWNFRIRRTIPRVSLFRLFVFPFYTGAACGFVWWLGYLGAIAVVFCFLGDLSDLQRSETQNAFCVPLFVFDYFYAALIIRTQFLSKWITPGKTWTIAVAMCAVGSLGSAFLYFLMTFQDKTLLFMEYYDESLLSIFNPFQLMFQLETSNATNGLLPQSYGALLWAAAMLPYLFYWLLVRLFRFSPEPTDDMLTYERAVGIDPTSVCRSS